jgi:hypothetical protein
MQPWRTAQVYPPNRWKKPIVELLSKGDILHLSGISDFNFISPQNHTPVTLSIQAQVTVCHDEPHARKHLPRMMLGLSHHSTCCLPARCMAPINSISFPINNPRGAGESQRMCHEKEVLCSLSSCRFLPAALCSSRWPRWKPVSGPPVIGCGTPPSRAVGRLGLLTAGPHRSDLRSQPTDKSSFNNLRLLSPYAKGP